jgi:hypothetical protein
VILAAVSVALILFILVDAFEALVYPRRVEHKFRLARWFYRGTWAAWTFVFRREKYMAVFGPLSLLGLLAVWASGLIFAFGLLSYALDLPVHTSDGPATLFTYLYLSAATFSTLGLGDVTPLSTLGRVITVTEAGVGFGFLAVVIGYLPVVYNHFSSREITISLLDARAGSPPSAAQFLNRLAKTDKMPDMDRFLREWEVWSAELLESSLSFPVLAYYRSQHDNQSWLSALTFILDTSALVLASVETPHLHQARLTFAMARHAVVDMAMVFRVPPHECQGRLNAQGWGRLHQELREAGVALRPGTGGEAKYAELRLAYEPFVIALSQRFLLKLPEIHRTEPGVDNWQTSAWTRRVAGIYDLAPGEHFDR